MPPLLARHGVTAILLAIILEELGVPMPIPTDLLIVFVGATAVHTPQRAATIFLVLLAASAIGASGLYLLIRRGGRPLVDRFGRYVHLGPQQLERAQAQLERRGWWAIAVGRAIPGLRYVTVIACGLLDVPYLRFLTAHIAGSAVYIATFLGLGAVFGPRVLDRIHLPHDALRLLWVGMIALGLPLLCAWSARRAMQQGAEPELPEPTHLVSVAASAVGTMSLAAMWSLLATLARLTGLPEPLTAVYLFGERHVGRAARGVGGAVMGYTLLLALCWVVGILDDAVRSRLHRWGSGHLAGRVAGLALIGTALVGTLLGGFVLITRPAAGGAPAVPILLGALWLLIGMLSFAATTVAIEVLGALTLAARGRGAGTETGHPAPSGPVGSTDAPPML